MTKRKTEPDDDTTNWHSIIDTISKNVRAIPRGTTLLTERLQQRCPGRRLYRQQVDAWLHPEPRKRNEPLAGMGLLLVEEAGDLVAEYAERPAKTGQKEFQ